MTAQRNHYEMLGVSPTASLDQIKTKYRELAHKFHPDMVKDKALGQKIFAQINQAYHVLADPERRSIYDADLRAAVAAATPRVATVSTVASARPVRTVPPAKSRDDNLQRAVNFSIRNAEFSLMNNDFQAVVVHCDCALRLDETNARVFRMKGDALASLARPREAAEAYRRSLAIAPSAIVQAELDILLMDVHRILPQQTEASTGGLFSRIFARGR